MNKVFKHKKLPYTAIWIVNNQYNVKEGDKFISWISLELLENSCDWEKVGETPILITEDGVEIYDNNQPLYFVFLLQGVSLYLNDKPILASDAKKYYPHKIFSTQEEANKYILYNKPILTLNEILSSGWDNVGSGKTSPLFERIVKAAKEKSNL